MRAILFGTCALVAGAVLVAMYRELARHFRDTPADSRFHVALAAEAVWAVVPCMIVLAGAAPAGWRVLSAQPLAALRSRTPEVAGHAASAGRVPPAAAQIGAREPAGAGD